MNFLKITTLFVVAEFDQFIKIKWFLIIGRQTVVQLCVMLSNKVGRTTNRYNDKEKSQSNHAKWRKTIPKDYIIN